VVPERFAPVLAELADVSALFREADRKLYLVGGSVRDLLLGLPAHSIDFDATTNARPEETKKILGEWADALWTQGEKFGTIGARKGDRVYEITTHRADAYHPDTRKPDVEFADAIETDLSRRDFTFNAMALELTSDSPTLIDPFNGVADLMTKVLRTPLDPDISFSDDPLRMIRAARFIARFGAVPTPELVDAVKASLDRLDIVSAERIRDELNKLIVVESPTAGLWFLVETGLADRFLPELPSMRLENDPIHRHKDVLTHTLAVIENVRPDARDDFDFRITRLAALFHDVGKPRTRGFQEGKGTTFHMHDVVGAKMTRKRLQALRFPNEDVEAVTELVRLHLRFHTYEMGWTDAAVRRYVNDAGPLLNELNVLTRCDCTTRNERKAARLSRRMDELEERIADLAAREELKALRPEMDGVEVMQHLGLEPGPAVGRAMAFLLEIRLEEGLIGDVEIRKRLDEWWAAAG
jgi:poly(A) polymerase